MMYRSIALLLPLLMTIAASGAPLRLPYWQMVKDVTEQIEARQARPVSINASLQTPGQEYPFESFRHLRPIDLIRAAKEGVREARLQAALGKSEEEINQIILANTTMAFEYLPLLLHEDKNIEEVILLMEKRDEEPVLRMFLIDRIVPGLVPDSLVSLSLYDFLANSGSFFTDRMLRIASHPSESPVIQSKAINAYYHFLLHEYKNILSHDPALKDMKDNRGGIDYSNPDQLTSLGLSPETQKALKLQTVKMEKLASSISGHILENSVRADEVKEQTRQTLELIRNTIIDVNQERIDAYLSGREYADPNALPSPMPMIPMNPDEDRLMIPNVLEDLMGNANAPQ